MTALKKYNRIECEGLWRPSEDGGLSGDTVQRREVVVSLGEATLVISDKNNIALTHWSLPAIHRVNPKQRPAIYSPVEDSSETLELEEDIMIKAIEKIAKAIERSRPKPGRVRYFILGSIILGVGLLAKFWLPDALVNQTLSVIPETKRIAIGNAVLNNIGQSISAPCKSRSGMASLTKLASRLSTGRPLALYVLSDYPNRSDQLPGGITLLNRNLVEQYDDPSVVAGFILAEQVSARHADPLRHLLKDVGFVATFKLLTSGYISPEDLKQYAEHFVLKPRPNIDQNALLDLFQTTRIRSTPYAYAVDPTGESTLQLIEADPFATLPTDPVLQDGEWISLQGICEE